MYSILQEFNETNSTLDKRKVCEKYRNNELFLRVFQLANDTVKYTFGVTMKNISYTPEISYDKNYTLEHALQDLEELFVSRKATGNNALAKLQDILEHLSGDDAKVLEMIINRDLRINFGKREYNKIVSKENKCISPPYMRCSLADKLDRIEYPAIVQQKADGTYRTLIIENGRVTLMGRSGEQDNFVTFNKRISQIPNGVYIGELMLQRYPLSKDRLTANGLINSDVEQDDMFMQCWDYLTLDEFKNKVSTVPYEERLRTLGQNLDRTLLEVIDGKYVDSYEEAMEYYKEQIKGGYEGAVLKNLNTPFKDHTSPTQIKLKEEAVAEFIITGFQEGKGRLAGTLGAMFYKSQDSMVTGKMGGFSDDIRKYIWDNQEKLLNSIVSVKYNGITKSKGSETFSLMFASFVELRPEKDEADNLQYIKNALC